PSAEMAGIWIFVPPTNSMLGLNPRKIMLPMQISSSTAVAVYQILRLPTMLNAPVPMYSRANTLGFFCAAGASGGCVVSSATSDPLRRRRAGLPPGRDLAAGRSEEHTSELQSRENLVCRLLLEKKKDILFFC